MSGRTYCTYFDHRYLTRGLAMFTSLQRHDPGATLWVLCMSEECQAILESLSLAGIVIVPLAELERADPELAACREARSPIEYYFTCSPCLPRFVLAADPEAQLVIYLDSDLYFFSSPEPVLRELGDHSVGLTPHGFTARTQRSHGRFGKYNVGWVSFRRSPEGSACLAWWRERCIDWCHDRVDGDRYADQKYLDQFEVRFSGVHALQHPGANLAPWNVAGRRVSLSGGTVMVDDEPLIFFHFQGIKALHDGTYDSNLTGYGARMSAPLRDGVFLPYLRELERVHRNLAARGLAVPDLVGIRRNSRGLVGAARGLLMALKTRYARWIGNVVRP